ncbi:MAG: type II toxin-antitoxin system VapC family toxin [Candidatus Limnocylindria bacterium]
MILIDSNVPMYLVGAAHPNKDRARQALEQCIAGGDRIVTDAEVLQEILHRYVAIGRRAAIQPAFDALLGVVDDVFSVERADVEEAKLLLLTADELSARDALHVAVMRRRDISRIMSFDRGFDGIPGVVRVSE